MKKLLGLTLLCTAFLFCFLSCSETEKTPEAKTILISAHQLDMYIGDESILTYYITPPGSLCNVFWNSSNDSVVSVDSIGQVKALTVGHAIISIQTNNGVTDSCLINVNPILVSRIVLNKSTANLLINREIELITSIQPQNATDKKIIWSSSNNNIATVDQNGKVKAKALGEAIISVTNQASGVSTNCAINVKEIRDFITLIFGYAGCSINNYSITGRLISTIKNDSPDTINIKSVSIFTSNCSDIKLYGEYGLYKPGAGLNAQFTLTNAYKPTVMWEFVWQGQKYYVDHKTGIRSL